MRRGTLNLGIVAHVDAGKTTLTERLLYAAGVIDELGSVDAGTTRTDTMALERQRGITIRSAVVSFELGGTTVNLIDTPGHPDFIAEVDRVLSLLDGAVLVVSAVEGVQPQSRVLMRALRRLRIPTLVFVNKIDRGGADPERVLAAVRSRLAPDALPVGTVAGAGGRAARFVPYAGDEPVLAEALAEHDDALLADYVADEEALTGKRLRAALAQQTRRCLVQPVFFGSAVTGEGVPELREALPELLPASAGDPDAPVSGRVFKIDRGRAGERIAYVRMYAGIVHTRDKLLAHGTGTETEVAPGEAKPVEVKPTAISVAEDGGWVRRPELGAGRIGRLWGLAGVRIGDTIGQPPPGRAQHRFAPPTLETVIDPVDPADGTALRGALTRLAEEDPLINVRVDDTGQEVSVSLYGEVQQEVLQATLAGEFGLAVTFRDSTTICVERPAGAGTGLEVLNTPSNPWHATVGLLVEPGRPGSGVVFRLRVETRQVPMFVYGSVPAFRDHMAGYVRQALVTGRYGWAVTDCVVTLVDCGYSVADGPPSKRGPDSTAADFRDVTPVVLRQALADAGTVVCEPTLRATLEAPAWAANAVLTALGRLGAAVRDQEVRGDLTTVLAALPATRLRDLRRQLPGLTSGEGVLESTFEGYRPVHGTPPVRPGTAPVA